LLEGHVPIASGCALGYVYFSVLTPGSHIASHCGPSNVRLRAHLGLVVPNGECSLRVGPEKRAWQEGKVLLFDDSFDHEVIHDGGSERIVLLIDYWHRTSPT